eukprot:SAG11_NODE_16005_length_559_cov_1.910870_1_plen_69_part_10
MYTYEYWVVEGNGGLFCYGQSVNFPLPVLLFPRFLWYWYPGTAVQVTSEDPQVGGSAVFLKNIFKQINK